MRRSTAHALLKALLLVLCSQATLAVAEAGPSSLDRALPGLIAQGKSASPVKPGKPSPTNHIQGSDNGTPGPVSPRNVPPGDITPQLPNSPAELPQSQPSPLCQAIAQFAEQLAPSKNQQGGAQSGPPQGGSCGPGGCNNSPSSGQSIPRFNGSSCGPFGCGRPFRSTGADRSFPSSRTPQSRTSSAFRHTSFSENSFGFGSGPSPARFSRKSLDTNQSYQYLGSALVDNQCVNKPRSSDEVQQLAEALTNVEKDQKKQLQNQAPQNNQGGSQIASQILQSLLGGLANGGLGGGGGPGGSPASAGGGSGKNPWQDAFRDTSRPTSVAELNDHPEQMDKLTDRELLALLKNPDFCEGLNADAKKKVGERLAEIQKKSEQSPSAESEQIQELIEENGTPPLQNLAEGWKRANNTEELTFTPEAQSMVDAIDESIKSGGTAVPYGNEATQSVGQLANDIMKSDMSAAEKATALGSLRYTVYQQQSDALFAIGKNASASQAWSNFNHNMGLMSQGLRERLASDSWLQANTTPASSVREFLSYSGYPGATNVNQGGYGSCWLCPTTGLNYRVNPGELAMMQNQGLTTGQIISPWTGQTANVSNWLKSPDNALYNPNEPVQNLRSPLVTMDQEAMAQFAGYGRAGGGGDPYAGLKGSGAYTGGVGHLVAGSGEGAGFLASGDLQQMAWAPSHYWSKDVINGTTLDASGNYVANSTLIGNNSWGSEPFETAKPFTAEGLASISMPGGGGAIGGGGGLGGLLGGVPIGFGPIGGGTSNNPNQSSPRPNPADEPAVQACLADICADIAAERLGTPESCQNATITVASTSQSTQGSSTGETTSNTGESANAKTANSSGEDRLARLLKRLQSTPARPEFVMPAASRAQK